VKSTYNQYFKVNRETWNKKVAIHAQSKFYDLAGFKKGNTSLNTYELEEIGDVKGKSMLHLQCHFGLDTLSWSRLGAQCTGIDLSDEGIQKAKLLNDELDLNATFIESNVYDVPKNVKGTFDIVFTSYGAVGWLPDLTLWANVIAEKLHKGGVFYMVEFHPISWMFSYAESPPKMIYPYQNSDVIYEEYIGTYTNTDASIICKEYCWNHGLGSVLSALINAGLEITFLHEFDKSPYNSFPDMLPTEDGMFVLKDHRQLFPLLYSIKATKK